MEDKKVYIVVNSDYDDVDNIYGVFENEDNANEYIKYNKIGVHYNKLKIITKSLKSMYEPKNPKHVCEAEVIINIRDEENPIISYTLKRSDFCDLCDCDENTHIDISIDFFNEDHYSVMVTDFIPATYSAKTKHNVDVCNLCERISKYMVEIFKKDPNIGLNELREKLNKEFC